MRKVAILGASDKADRISYQLLQRLLVKGHTVYPIHPVLKSIDGVTVYRSLAELPEKPDVLSLYVNGQRSAELAPDIQKAGAKRVIFNPGAENPELARTLADQGVDAIEACSLVLLSQDAL